MYKKIGILVVVPILMMLMLISIFGCSKGGDSPVIPETNENPPKQQDPPPNQNPGQQEEPAPGPREVLSAFADACDAKDIDAACDLLFEPERWKGTLEEDLESIPLLGPALREAQELAAESNYIEYLVRIFHPSNPDYVRENYVYAVVNREGEWKIDFEYPDVEMLGERIGESVLDERSGQWEANNVHPLLTEYIIKYYCNKYNHDTEFVDDLDAINARDAMKKGSTLEDFKPDDVAKFMAHFYTPKTQSSHINPGAIEFIPVGRMDVIGVKALDWALGQGVIPPLSAYGIGWNTELVGNPNSFQKAVSKMKNSIGPGTRAEAYETFGFTLHLLQDIGAPAHVRNDIHLPLPFGIENDLMENWTSKVPGGLQNESDALYQKILSTPRIKRNNTGFPDNGLLDTFYHNPETLLPCSSVQALFKYTAVMANRMCFSNDTTWENPIYPVVADTSKFPEFIRADLGSFPGARFFGSPGDEVLYNLQLMGIIKSNADDYLIGRGNTLFDNWLVWFNFIHNRFPTDGEIRDKLKNGNYITLKDKDDNDYFSNNKLGVREQQWQLLFPLIVKTGAAYLHEFYLYTHGNDVLDGSPWDPIGADPQPSNLPDYKWSGRWTGPPNPPPTTFDPVNDITSDNSGNVYVAGYFRGSVDFDPGPGVSTYTSKGGNDAFLTKFDPYCGFQWTKTWGGTVGDEANGIAADSMGDLYVTGRCSGKVDFDPGPGKCEVIVSAQHYSYLSKFDTLGNFQWVRGWEGQGNDVTIGHDDTIYTTGSFDGTVDFDPTESADEHQATGYEDAFISGFDTDGDFRWARTWGGDGYCWGRSLAVDCEANVYILGSYTGTVDFDPGPGSETRMSNGYIDAFLSKFDSMGNLLWTQTWGGGGQDDGWTVVTDHSGNVYAAGRFMWDMEFDPYPGSNPSPGKDRHFSKGYYDGFLVKFNSEGTYVWARTIGGVLDDSAKGVAVDGYGNVYVTSLFSDYVDFDPGIGSAKCKSNGQTDIYLCKFNNAGTFQWVITWGGNRYDEGRAVTVNTLGDIFVAGDFRGTVDFDPGPGVEWRTAIGEHDVFLSRFSQTANLQF